MVMDAGDVKFTVKLDDKNFNAKMTQVGQRADALSKKFKTMGKVMVGVGIAMAAALGAAVTAYVKAGDEVHKMALRTGFATEALSELRHVAMLAGADLSAIEKATKKMSKTITDAGYGLETYVRVFRKLGLNVEDLKRMKPEEQFWTIANAMSDLEDHTLKVAIAQDVFGRAGTQLLPMLASGSEAIAEMRQEAHDLGIVFDEEAAVKAAKLNDAIGTLKESLQGVAFEIAEDLVPVITEFLENDLIPTITKVKDWIDANEGLALTLAKVAGILVVGGALLLGLGMVSRAIIAINAALIVMHGLAGPAGWAKLALGIGIAAGAIYGMSKLLEVPEVPGTIPEMPSMQFGGIVPGPIGKPVGITAHGGEQFAGVGRSFGAVHIHIGNFMGDETALREFSLTVKEIIWQETRRTSFSGINSLEYFPGSRAP